MTDKKLKILMNKFTFTVYGNYADKSIFVINDDKTITFNAIPATAKYVGDEKKKKECLLMLKNSINQDLKPMLRKCKNDLLYAMKQANQIALSLGLISNIDSQLEVMNEGKVRR